MARMAGLHNVLVHLSTATDLRRVHAAYTAERDVLQRFASWVASQATHGRDG